MYNELIAALKRIAERMSVAMDKGTHEGALKGWETRRHGRPSIWEEVKTRDASPAFRDFRNRLKAISKLPSVIKAVGKLGGFGTFDVETGVPITSDKRSSGYQVSFCTTTTEDPKHPKYLNNGAFDSTVEEMARQTESRPEVGVFKGGHEISFHVRTKKQAEQLMRYHNQVSTLIWKNKKTYDNAVASGKYTADQLKELFEKQFLGNDFFDPTTNTI